MAVMLSLIHILTWLVPAGEFNRIENAQGVSVVDPNSFHWLERSSVNFLLIPYYIIQMCIRDRHNGTIL